MEKKICVIQGHPHDDETHLCHALSDAYEAGAREAGHDVNTLRIAAMDFSFLRNQEEFESAPTGDILAAQEVVRESDHLAVFYPLWLGSMPALTKAFFEQLTRNDFAISESEHGWPRKMLKGKSARVVVTMGMPSSVYRLFFGAHGVKSFEGSVLAIAGIKPIRDTLIGGAEQLSKEKIEDYLQTMHSLGAKAE